MVIFGRGPADGAAGAAVEVSAAGAGAFCATTPARYPLSQINSSREEPAISSCIKVIFGVVSIRRSFFVVAPAILPAGNKVPCSDCFPAIERKNEGLPRGR